MASQHIRRRRAHRPQAGHIRPSRYADRAGRHTLFARHRVLKRVAVFLTTGALIAAVVTSVIALTGHGIVGPDASADLTTPPGPSAANPPATRASASPSLAQSPRARFSPSPSAISSPLARTPTAPGSPTARPTGSTAAPLPGVPEGVAWQSSDPAASWQDPGGVFLVNNNEWSGDAGPQTIWANSYHSWGVVSDQASTTDVKVYPDVEDPIFQADNDPLYSRLASINSTFAEQMPPASDNYLAEAAYDVWMNTWDTEMMIWVDNHGQDLEASGDTLRATMMSGGQTWQLWTNGSGTSGYYAFVLKGNEQSGNVKILDFIDYLVANKYLPNTTTITAIEFGWEISSTNSVPLDFKLTNYSLGLVRN